MPNRFLTGAALIGGLSVNAKDILNGLLGLLLALSLLSAPADAQDRTAQSRSEKRAARAGAHAPLSGEQEIQDALKQIPWDTLGPAARTKLKSVVYNHSLFRRMPAQAVYCDPDIYRFLLEHPDLVVGFWERLGMTQIALREIREDRYQMKEATGTVAHVEVLYRTDELSIVYAKGSYRGPFLARAIDGETVLILRTRYGWDADDDPYVVCRLDTFIRIENIGADLLAKLFSTTLGKIADGNFEQTVAFIGHVSDASTVGSESVKRVARGVKGVRGEVRDDFLELVDQVVLRSTRRDGRLFPQYEALADAHAAPEEPEPLPAEPWPSTASRFDGECSYPDDCPSTVSPPLTGRVIFGTPKIVRADD